MAIDAHTGEPVGGFGVNGVVDLLPDRGAAHFGRQVNPRLLTHSSPVAVVGDVVIVGSIVHDGAVRREAPPGHVRAFDVRTGELRWIFHTIAQEGEPGVETWENESWRYTGNTNVWSMMAVDPELGRVYLPISTPTNDFYGGHRLGDNLYAESIVCLEAATGKRLWHFQAIHHGLWDYDLPTSPNLVDITVDGRRIRALAQVSKQGFTYVLDRVTGEPVWPIEERPVPVSDVPGERAAGTQPFPTKPPPFERQGMTEDQLNDLTPELLAEAKTILAGFRSGPLYTPPSLGSGTIQLPGAGGGANWPGAAFDPETATLYVPSSTQPSVHPLSQPDQARSDLAYVGSFLAGARGPRGLPLVKPPWGRVTAIDLDRGEHLWMTPNGHGPGEHPALAGLQLGMLGGGSGAAARHEDAPLRDAGARSRRRRHAAHQRLRQDHGRAARSRAAAGEPVRQPGDLPAPRQAVPGRRRGRRPVLRRLQRGLGGDRPRPRAAAQGDPVHRDDAGAEGGSRWRCRRKAVGRRGRRLTS